MYEARNTKGHGEFGDLSESSVRALQYQRGVQYQLGKHQVPVDIVRPEAIRRSRETTRPLEESRQERRGPNFDDLARLDTGEVQTLCVADRYRLGRRLGKGGMAIVFRGEHVDLGRPVAVKILSERHAERHQALARFLREARLSARIRHENIVEVFDFGSTPEGVVYLVMELLQGEDLRALIGRHEGLSWARTRSLMLQICAGLAAAHEVGVIHRDLKPSNCYRVLTGEREQIKLLDFGIATLVREPDESLTSEDARDGARITGSGAVIGTPEYMSPEQARGEAVDARSDVYAAGLILCELLTGQVPFTGKSPTAVLAAQIYEEPATLQELAPEGVDIDPRVQAIYARALAKDPEERFASIEEMAEAIAAVEPGGPVKISGAFSTVAAAPTDELDDIAYAEPVELRPRRRAGWRFLAAAAVLALLAGAAALALPQRGAASEQPTATAAEHEGESNSCEGSGEGEPEAELLATAAAGAPARP